MQRRKFLQTSGLFAAGALSSRFTAIASPFAPGELGYQIPVDKKIDPEWIRSLYKRGFVTKYLQSRNELQYIGMPVGGINAGTVYLGGDGRMWLWDIFNTNQNGIDPKEIDWPTELHVGKKVRSQDGSAYVAPAKDIRPLDQGFAFKIMHKGGTVVKRMLAADWDDIVFEATYPMAKITYIDKQLPVQIVAEIFSPFIPLDELNSGLPATIYSFSVKNNSAAPVQVQITGWIENKTGIRSAGKEEERINTTFTKPGSTGVLCFIESKTDPDKLTTQPDYGTLSVAALHTNSHAMAAVNEADDEALFARSTVTKMTSAIDKKLTGAVCSSLTILPNQTQKADFIFAWHFANLTLAAIPDAGQFYNTLFKNAAEVTAYVQTNFTKLAGETRLWKDTFYDSTLPYWFLERTFLNIGCLATTTSHRMESGRYYAWEGVGCCEGTCTHVWQYAQASGRIFPHMEKDIRQRVDLGLSLQKDGSMWYRCEADKRPAVDGQAGTILRFYREHQMSTDTTFLQQNWRKIKTTIQYLMSLDKNTDGMEDTPLMNTLDAEWDGEIAWIVGLCIAAVKAGELMAIEMKDDGFAKRCAEYFATGKQNMEDKLFNGEYFIHRPDAAKGRKNLGSYNTCHIDQVYGQSWAFQAGIGRVLDKEKTMSALRSLWKYNFTPDVGPYLKDKVKWRPYALPGEGGLIMNTNPKNEPNAYGENVSWQIGYFHECMSGFEHQVAAHMMAEGMTDEALVLTRTIHDRYHAAKRNPFNEIECSDHYARAMASYGTFITACGFEYHGPKGYIKFAPKITPSHFKAPFTSAAGWGTYEQQQTATTMASKLHVQYGSLQLQTISLETAAKATQVSVLLGVKNIPCHYEQANNQLTITLATATVVNKNQSLQIKIA
jgi:non-lysosomal glucosylceramidase